MAIGPRGIEENEGLAELAALTLQSAHSNFCSRIREVGLGLPPGVRRPVKTLLAVR